MKKLITTMLCITFFAVSTNAVTYYVNIGLATGANDGSNWENAFQTWTAATTAASGNAGVDNVYIKGAISYPGSAWTMSVDNYYGSFEGVEASPSQRPMNDNDGNGIAESWEFKYPTTFTSGNNATAINCSAAILDGFTITHTGTRDNAMFTTLISPIGSIVQNCVFTGSNISYTNMAQHNGGCLIKTVGTFKNNLVEKNNVSVTYGAADIKIAPILDVPSPTSSVIISGCVFRNNKVTISNTGGTAVTSLKGMILNITANSVASSVNISDCIVHNNEAIYTGGGSNLTASRASIAGSLNFSASLTSDVYTNCLFANNKTTNMVSCMHVMQNTNVVHKGYNNVFWNNQNTVSSTSVTSAVSMNSSSAQNAGSVFSNNYLDVAKTGSWDPSGTTVWNITTNQTNLSKSNTGSNGPYFLKPPKNVENNVIGANRIGGSADSIAIAHADWRIYSNSYLVGKGTTTIVLKDKAGNDFSLTTPSVGAYEFAKLTPVITWNQNLTGFVTNNDPLTIALTATSTEDAINGVAITYTSSDESIVAISGTNLVIQGKVGTVTITAQQASNANFNAATDVIKTCSIAYGVYTAVNNQVNNQKLFTVTQNGILINTDGVIQVVSFGGKIVQNTKVINGEFIPMMQGAYILRITTNKGVCLQKVVF